MPSPDQILAGLTHIANQWQALAIVWHVYFALLAAGLLLGMRPPQRMAGMMLALPLFSVSIMAWLISNPFNGTLFALLGIGLVVVALRLPDDALAIAPTWAVAAGVVLFIFAWVYPHFLTTTSFVPYLYAAPLGLIPCPTLSMVIGMSLIVGGFDSRTWSLVLGVAGLFYGVIGAMQLGVLIDMVLLVGALALVLLALWPHGHRQAPALAH